MTRGAAKHRTIAIHHRRESYSDRWIARCEELGHPYRIVDGHDADVLRRLEGAAALLWHVSHNDATDLLVARPVLEAAALMGVQVFPDHPSAWHFDDKLAQKYLFEAVGAPFVRTYAFFDRAEALAWVAETRFPKVFKLRRGSGSRNVRLVRTRAEAERLVRRAFGDGFRPSGMMLGETWKLRAAWERGRLASFLRELPAKLHARRHLDGQLGRERGYVYFQDFVPDLRSDTRVIVIGDRAVAAVRLVRAGDFRASGSGAVWHEPAKVRLECVELGFRVTRAIGAQSLALDILEDAGGRLALTEVSYGFDPRPVYEDPGSWDEQLRYTPGHIFPEDLILEDVLRRVEAGA